MKLIIRNILVIILFCSPLRNIVFSQTRSIQWEDSKLKDQKFPFAYINGSTTTEKEINNYLQNKYINQSESYRDNFSEYEYICPLANICAVTLTYEHEFNTSPGSWSFTEYNYFDLRDGKVIQINRLIKKEKYDDFLSIANERKNEFIQNFKKGLTKDQEDYNHLIEIVDYTIKEPIKSSDIENVTGPKAMSSVYELRLDTSYLVLSYYWEYGWGLGRQSLPNIDLKFTYKELLPFLNDYAKELLFTTPLAPENKLFYGYIGGKYKISALVRDYKDSVKITYWYESNKIPINWIGVIENKKFILSETDMTTSKNIAKITITFYEENKKIRGIGKWND